MDRFGQNWVRHTDKIQDSWERKVGNVDVVLLPGDISWAKRFPEAIPDLRWLDSLPGRKVVLKGNHDVWWPSPSVLQKDRPASLHFIQNNHVRLGDYIFFGSRLWDTEEYSHHGIIDWDPKKGAIPEESKSGAELKLQESVYNRELARLQLSIESIPKGTPGIRIGLTHFPPLNYTLTPSRASKLLEGAGARQVVFGHLHSIRAELKGTIFGKRGEVEYHLTSCDYLDFSPKLIFD